VLSSVRVAALVPTVPAVRLVTAPIVALELFVVRVIVSPIPRTASALSVTDIKRPVVAVAPVTVAPVTAASVAVVGATPVANEYVLNASPAA